MDMLEFNICINDYCNFKCPYCCTNTPYKNTHKNINIAYIKYLVKILNLEFKDKKIIYNILGGEPFLSKNINDILTILLYTDNLSTLNILTNGSIDFSGILDKYKNFYDYIFIDMTRHNQVYNNIVLDKNIKYLLDNNINYTINLLYRYDKSIDDLYNIEIDRIYSELINNYNNIYIKKRNIFPTKYFKIDNFNYDLCNNSSNHKVAIKNSNKNNMLINPYRNIDIYANGKFTYNCKFIDKTLYNIVNLYNILIKNVNKFIYCKDYTKCECMTCVTEKELKE